MQVYTPQGDIHNFQQARSSPNSSFIFFFLVDLPSSPFLPTMNMFFQQSVETGISVHWLHVALL